MFDNDPQRPAPPNDAALEAMIDDVFRQSRGRGEIPGMEFKAMALASYDAHQRRARNQLSFSLFADAFQWRLLGRPLASIGVLASLCAAGFVAGSITASPDYETYAALDAAFSQSFDLSQEDGIWVEE